MKSLILKNEKGQVLIIVLFIMLFIFLLISALADLMSVDTLMVNNQLQSIKTGYIADAGIEDGISRLRLNDRYAVTNLSVNFPSGSSSTYTFTVWNTGDSRTIISTATLGNYTQVKEAEFRISGRANTFTVNILFSNVR